jgi:hypothetical protein
MSRYEEKKFMVWGIALAQSGMTMTSGAIFRRMGGDSRTKSTPLFVGDGSALAMITAEISRRLSGLAPGVRAGGDDRGVVSGWVGGNGETKPSPPFVDDPRNDAMAH